VNWWFKRQAILADIHVALEHYDAYGLAERLKGPAFKHRALAKRPTNRKEVHRRRG